MSQVRAMLQKLRGQMHKTVKIYAHIKADLCIHVLLARLIKPCTCKREPSFINLNHESAQT